MGENGRGRYKFEKKREGNRGVVKVFRSFPLFWESVEKRGERGRVKLLINRERMEKLFFLLLSFQILEPLSPPARPLEEEATPTKKKKKGRRAICKTGRIKYKRGL